MISYSVPVSFTICPICKVKIGLCGIGTITYEICPECKNKTMKIEDLKVGDRIKHSHGTGNIDLISATYVMLDNDKHVRKKDIISKLEPQYKEIPIEHPKPPMKPFKFDFRIKSWEHHSNSIWSGGKGRVIGQAIFENGAYMDGACFPFNPEDKLSLDKTYTVEIKEKE